MTLDPITSLPHTEVPAAPQTQTTARDTLMRLIQSNLLKKVSETDCNLSVSALSEMATIGLELRQRARIELIQHAELGDREAAKVLRNQFGHRAIYAGTFDPFTRGHRDMVERGIKLFDEIIVAVGRNPAKQPLFTDAERVTLIKEDLKNLGPAVRVLSFSDALVALARRENCNVILRGVREVTDFSAENLQALVNLNLSEGQVETLMLPAKSEYGYVSSSMVKAVAAAGEEFSDFLTPHVEQAFRDRLAIQALRMRWLQFQTHLSLDKKVSEDCFSAIVDSYSESTRAHHRLHHIEEMFRFLERVVQQSESKELCAAIFFHDIVYNSKSNDNELQSAQMARKWLGLLGQSEEFIQEVERLILLTISHKTIETDSNGKLLLDADLSVLNSSRKRYDRYARDIRFEYSWVAEDAYRNGRTKILNSFIKRESLFCSSDLRSLDSELWRSNIRREILELK